MFPGSNCDRDIAYALRVAGFDEVVFLWHGERELFPLGVEDLVVLPGGFSYGDYLRAGAIAAHSPIMEAVREHAERGGLVLGICNGFQILCEAGLLPGVLLPNVSGRFVCRHVEFKVERNVSVISAAFAVGERLCMPVAHGEGRYWLSAEGLSNLEERGQIVFRYVDNPNGSAGAVAGVCNERGNVLGMMPHPERAIFPHLGFGDGLRLLQALLACGYPLQASEIR